MPSPNRKLVGNSRSVTKNKQGPRASNASERRITDLGLGRMMKTAETTRAVKGGKRDARKAEQISSLCQTCSSMAHIPWSRAARKKSDTAFISSSLTFTSSRAESNAFQSESDASMLLNRVGDKASHHRGSMRGTVFRKLYHESSSLSC